MNDLSGSPTSNGHNALAANLNLCGCPQCSGTTGLDTSGSGGLLPNALNSIPSGLNAIDALLAGDSYRWNYNSTVGSSVSVTYSWRSSVPSYYAAGSREVTGFAAVTAAQQTAISAALALYAEVANISFTFDATGNGALQFAQTTMQSGVAAYAYYAFNPAWDQRGGDVWLGSNVAANANPSVGSYGFMTVVHELGHALGLKHPGNYNAGGGGTSGPYLPAATDNVRYTVMSYYGGNGGSNNPQTLMLYDIMAIQHLYGANTATRAGNSTYSWGLNQNFVQAIWDGGGTDIIDASNQSRRSIIDLRAGSFSSIGASGANDASQNLAIAYGVVIENASGGAGNDYLWGNSAGNTLSGAGGVDIIYGGSGNDVLQGGSGNDTLIGGTGSDTVVLSGTQGNYTVVSTGSVTTVSGPDGTDYLSGIETIQFQGGGTLALPGLSSPVHGDVNGDGLADLVWRSSSTGLVNLWTLNGGTASGYGVTQINFTGNGTATSDWMFRGGGDFDGDGRRDLIWHNAVSGQVYIWMLDGFTVVDHGAAQFNGADSALATSWMVEATEDFTGDGKADILWRNSSTGQLYFWQMDGRSNVTAGTGAVQYNGADSYLPATWRVEGTADFTGDGRADILWRNSADGQLFLWQMNGRSSVTGANTGIVQYNGANANIGMSWRVEGTADFTGDGKADILWRNSADGQVFLWQMNGRASVAGSNTQAVQLSSSVPVNIGTTASWRIEGVADMSGDSSADVFLRNPSNGQLYYWQLTDNSIGTNGIIRYNGSDAYIPTSWAVERLADFTGDGKADILWRNSGDGQLFLWQMDGQSNVVAGSGAVSFNGSNAYIPSSWRVESAADFTGDGKADILWRNSANGQVYLWQMNGKANVAGGTGIVQYNGADSYIPMNWRVEGTADFTGDGKADILWRNTTDGQLFLWQMNGKSSVAGANTGIVQFNGSNASVPVNWRVEGTADFTGDGKADILWRNSADGQVYLWQMDGRSSVAANTGVVQFNGANAAVSVASGWQVARTADVTADGKADILWRNTSDGQVYLWRMDGRTATSHANVTITQNTATVGSASEVLGTDDYNGDGKSDVLWRNTSTGQVSLWAMNGATVGSTSTVQLGGANAVVSSDWRALV